MALRTPERESSGSAALTKRRRGSMDWCVVEGSTMHCCRCGARKDLSDYNGKEMHVFLLFLKAHEEEHRRCRPREAGAA